MTVAAAGPDAFADLLRGAAELGEDDATPALALADWLEERGDARSEVLRLSCRADAASPAVAERLRAALGRAGRVWAFPRVGNPPADAGWLDAWADARAAAAWATSGGVPDLPTRLTLDQWVGTAELRGALAALSERPGVLAGVSNAALDAPLAYALSAAGPAVRALSVGPSAPAPDLLPALLRDLPRLGALSVQWFALADADLPAVGRLSGLRRLELTGCARLTDAGTAALAGMTGLRQIRLRSCPLLGDGTLEAVSALPGLRRLDVSDCQQTTAAGLAGVCRPRRLESLRLGWIAAGDERTLRRLLDLTNLRCLMLHHWSGRMPAWFFEGLADWPGLSYLDLYGCGQLADDALAPLGESRSLRSLDLSRCANLTDATLRMLERVPTLEWLDTQNCAGMSVRGRERLRRALPGCRVLTARQR